MKDLIEEKSDKISEIIRNITLKTNDVIHNNKKNVIILSDDFFTRKDVNEHKKKILRKLNEELKEEHMI